MPQRIAHERVIGPEYANLLEELQGAADETGMRTLIGSTRTSPLTRTVAVVAAMFVLLVGASDASWAANGDEGWWPDFDQPGFWWGTKSVTELNGDLVVSGDFWFVDGHSLRWVVRRSGRDWLPMGAGLASSLDDLTVFHGSLLGVAGERGQDTRASLRQWNGSVWSSVAGQPVSIRKIVPLSSGKLLAVTGSRLHEWDGERWAEFGPVASFDLPVVEWSDGVAIAEPDGQVVVVSATGLEPLGTPGGRVTLLAVTGGWLVRGVRLPYSTGYVNGVGRMQKWNGVEWEPMGGTLDQRPTHLIDGPDGPEILCQESETYGLGQQTRRWDGSEWIPTGVWFDYSVSEWKELGGRRVAAGQFWVADGCAARGLAIDNGNGYQPLIAPQSPVGGTDLPVHALIGYQGRLVAGGNFVTIGEKASPFLAIGDGRTWSSLGGGVDGSVLAMAEFNGDLIVAGDFQTAGDVSASRVARWDGTQWHAMGDGLDGGVLALASHDGRLYAGGRFRHSGTRLAPHLAAWDGETWVPVSDFDRPVHALAEFQGHLYAGGLFQRVGGAACAYLARQDGSTWTAVRGVGGAVLALAPHEGKLAVGGQVRRLNGEPVPPVLMWDGQWLRPLPVRGFDNDQAYQVSALLGTPRGLVIGGGGSSWYRRTPLEALARWNGEFWEPLGSGVQGVVHALALVNGSLFVGGDFTSAGGRSSERLARWDEGIVPAVVGGVTVDRDEDEVRLTWSAAGMTNLSSIEVWVGPETAGNGDRPAIGQGTMIGSVARGLNGAFEFVDASSRPDGARYWLRQIGPFGSDSWSGPYALAPLPPGARIQSIGPNPFFGATHVHYTLDRAGTVAIEVFDTQGRRIRVLQRGEHPAGVFEAEWDGRSDAGADVASGTYWVRLATRDGIQSRRILRLR